MEQAIAESGNQTKLPDTISEIVSQGGGGRRAFFWLAWILGVIAVLAIVGTLLAPLIPRSLSFRARKMIELPKDARVVEVDDVLGNGFGDVYFTLPEPKGPATRLDEVWTGATFPMWSPSASAVPVPAGRVHGPGWTPLPKSGTLSAKSSAPGSLGSKITPASTAPRAKAKIASKLRGPGVVYPWSPAIGFKRSANEYMYDGYGYRVKLQFDRATGRYHFSRSPKPMQVDSED